MALAGDLDYYKDQYKHCYANNITELIMEQSRVLGIVKFFKNERHLDDLISGTLYCNTPEYYRLHDEQGVADHNECVTLTYRAARDDEKPTFIVGEMPITNLTRVTIRNQGLKDGWLHCWCILRMPDGKEELVKLVEDISQLREEFGVNYAYIEPDKVKLFVERIQKNSPYEIRAAQEVKYSSDRLEWSPICKDERYSHQREYRILIGECSEHSLERLKIKVPDGFQDIIHKNIGLRIGPEDNALFQMSKDKLVHNK